MQKLSVDKSRLTEEEIREYAVELFLDSLPSIDEEKGITKSGEQHGKQRQNTFQGRKATWKDFYATEDREEREAILQEIYNGQLTPSELKEIMDA